MADEWGAGSGVDVRAYGRLLWRRKWLVAGVVAISGLAGVVIAGDGRVTSYTSSARVLVKPITASPLDRPARVDQAVDLDTEREILSSTAVAALAGAKLATSDTAAQLAERVTTAVSPDTQILHLSYRAATPAAAQAGAQAFAEAYLDYKTTEALDAVKTITDSIQGRIAELETQLRDANAALASRLPTDPAYIEADSSRGVATSQIALLRNQISSYTAVDIDPGAIIQPAGSARPNSARQIPVPLTMAAGFLVGLTAAFVRDRFDDRVHHPADVAGLLDLPLLASIPRRLRGQRRHLIAAPNTPDTEAYQRLATNIMAMHRSDGIRTVLITSPSPNEGKTTVAANLAVALSRSQRVALVSADLRCPTLQALFSIPAGHPSLTDLLEGHATAADVKVVDPHWPALALYPSRTTTGHPTQQLQSGTMTRFLRDLAETHDLVIVDAAPVLPVADTLPLATAADATILVARQNATTQTAVTETVDQLAQIGTRLVGVVATHTAKAKTNHGYYRTPAQSDPPARSSLGPPAEVFLPEPEPAFEGTPPGAAVRSNGSASRVHRT